MTWLKSKSGSWLMGRNVTHATANAQVAAAPIHSGTAAFARNRSTHSITRSPTTGSVIMVAQKVKRSNVRTSNARPRSTLGTGVVPPKPNKKVSQKPNNSGRNLRSADAFNTTNGNSNIKAP